MCTHFQATSALRLLGMLLRMKVLTNWGEGAESKGVEQCRQAWPGDAKAAARGRQWCRRPRLPSAALCLTSFSAWDSMVTRWPGMLLHVSLLERKSASIHVCLT